MAKWKKLKPDEKRLVDGLCPCCGSQAYMRCINLVVSVRCIDMACGLKVERWIVNERTQAVCEQECLKVWQRRDEIVPQPPAFSNLPDWAKYVAQDYKGQWHCYEQHPMLDGSTSSWNNDRGSRFKYTGVDGPKNPYWWKTVHYIHAKPPTRTWAQRKRILTESQREHGFS